MFGFAGYEVDNDVRSLIICIQLGLWQSGRVIRPFIPPERCAQMFIDPYGVGECSCIVSCGFTASGIAPSAKHFPGHWSILTWHCPAFSNPSTNCGERNWCALACQQKSSSAGSKHSASLVTQRNGREDAAYDHRSHHRRPSGVDMQTHVCPVYSRGVSPAEFPDIELENALDFIDASLDFYKDGSHRRIKIHELQTLGCLVSPEVNRDLVVTKPDGATSVICPTNR